MGKTFFCKHTWIRDQLIGRDTFSRQNDAGSDEIESTDITGPGAEAAAAGDNEIRCVPKVMQVGALFQNDIFSHTRPGEFIQHSALVYQQR